MILDSCLLFLIEEDNKASRSRFISCSAIRKKLSAYSRFIVDEVGEQGYIAINGLALINRQFLHERGFPNAPCTCLTVFEIEVR
jgi:hypothetical protein